MPHLGVAFSSLSSGSGSPASSGREGAAAGAVGTGSEAVTLVCRRVGADFAIARHLRPPTATKEPGRGTSSSPLRESRWLQVAVGGIPRPPSRVLMKRQVWPHAGCPGQGANLGDVQRSFCCLILERRDGPPRLRAGSSADRCRHPLSAFLSKGRTRIVTSRAVSYGRCLPAQRQREGRTLAGWQAMSRQR